MTSDLTFDQVLNGCDANSFDDGIRIDSELVPLGGPGSPVKSAVYEGGTYQHDRRWASVEDPEPQHVIVIDNVPSQANRLEEALRKNRESIGLPEFILDFSDIPELPPHLPRSLSSLQFPHRNADAYLRDAQLKGKDFIRTELGRAIFDATAQSCGPLIAWFPQALLYGFWQSHLGKKRSNSKHARAWVSEITGWQPASTEYRVLGLKGDALNLNTSDTVTSNPDDQTKWEIGKDSKIAGGKQTRLSEIGHGQVPFMGSDANAAAISFTRITLRATVSFAQLRRIQIDSGSQYDKVNSSCRALLVALGLHAHQLAFGRGFSLRSGAALRPKSTKVTWLGGESDREIQLGDVSDTLGLIHAARDCAESVGVPLDGWGNAPTVLKPKKNLEKAIRDTWPTLEG